MSDAEPGWYPDHLDPTRERWWDGGSWSHVTRPAPAARRGVIGPVGVAQPGQGGPPTDAGAPTPSYPPPSYPPSYPPYGTPYGTPFGTPYGGTEPGPDPYRGPLPTPPSRYPAGTGQTGRPPGPVTPDGALVSAPGWRLLARIIDKIIIGLLSLAPGFASARAMYRAVRAAMPPAGSTASLDPLAMVNNSAYLTAATDLSLIQVAVGAVYTVAFLALRGATPGKLAVGIRVRPWAGEARPTWNQAGLRWLTSDAIGAVPGLGILWWVLDSMWLLWDPRRQALHDKLPGTVVVRRG